MIKDFDKMCNEEVYKEVAEHFNIPLDKAQFIMESQFWAIADFIRKRHIGKFKIAKVGTLYFDKLLYDKFKLNGVPKHKNLRLPISPKNL